MTGLHPKHNEDRCIRVLHKRVSEFDCHDRGLLVFSRTRYIGRTNSMSCQGPDKSFLGSCWNGTKGHACLLLHHGVKVGVHQRDAVAELQVQPLLACQEGYLHHIQSFSGFSAHQSLRRSLRKSPYQVTIQSMALCAAL